MQVHEPGFPRETHPCGATLQVHLFVGCPRGEPHIPRKEARWGSHMARDCSKAGMSTNVRKSQLALQALSRGPHLTGHQDTVSWTSRGKGSLFPKGLTISTSTRLAGHPAVLRVASHWPLHAVGQPAGRTGLPASPDRSYPCGRPWPAIPGWPARSSPCSTGS